MRDKQRSTVLGWKIKFHRESAQAPSYCCAQDRAMEASQSIRLRATSMRRSQGLPDNFKNPRFRFAYRRFQLTLQQCSAMARQWGAGLLLTIHAALVGWIGLGMCPIRTETGHMAASVYFWHMLRFDVFNVNPPLTRVISGLPVVFCDPKYDWDYYSMRPQDRSEWAMGAAFIAANGPEKTRWCFTLARCSLIPLLLLGGYFGYRLSREMYGDAAAFVFLALWCFSPLLLAWGATVCPDAVGAALGIVAVYTFRQWLHKPDWIHTAIAGVCVGLLPLTKLTWIIAIGLWPLIWCLWTVPIYLTKADRCSLPLPPFRQLAAMLLLGLYVLNMGYLFDGSFRPLGKYVFISRLFSGQDMAEYQQQPTAANRFAGTWLGAIPLMLPADFVQGIDTQRLDFERGLPSYLRGQWADHGWWYYYLYALAVKVPLGTWCLVVLAIGITIFGRGYSASWRDEMLVLVPFVVILIVVSSQTGFSVHSRYILPALPFLFVWASKVGRVFEIRPFTRKRLVMAATIVLALTWSVSSSLAVYPHSLSYFNALAVILPTPADATYPSPGGKTSILSTIISAGPRNGPRHLLDSNIDWGQDLFYLEDWYESHPEARPIKVAYFGGYPLDKSKIKSDGYPPIGQNKEQIDGKTDTTTFGPLPGWYAVSVNEIYGRSQQYRYFLNFQPVAMAGYSLYIYHITPDEANRVRRGLGLAILPSSGSTDK